MIDYNECLPCSNIGDLDDMLDQHAADCDSDSQEVDLDYNQDTVRSMGGISVDTQDSTRYENAPFPCGNIKFLSNPSMVEEIEVCYGNKFPVF